MTERHVRLEKINLALCAVQAEITLNEETEDKEPTGSMRLIVNRPAKADGNLKGARKRWTGFTVPMGEYNPCALIDGYFQRVAEGRAGVSWKQFREEYVTSRVTDDTTPLEVLEYTDAAGREYNKKNAAVSKLKNLFEDQYAELASMYGIGSEPTSDQADAEDGHFEHPDQENLPL